MRITNLNAVIFLVLVFGFFSCQVDDFEKDLSQSSKSTESRSVDYKYFHTYGKEIFTDKGAKFKIKSIGLGNRFWENSSEEPVPSHSKHDFSKIKRLGFNTIRFYLNYALFEDDSQPFTYKQSGWDWLDKNIRWAKENNLYLLLNMHYPQGGYQSQGNGDALWNNTENQRRLKGLWRAIANRYKLEKNIIGYGLLNEPVPNKSIQQWDNLANELVETVRSKDQNHLIFLEKALYVKKFDPDNYKNSFFPRVKGKNIVYEFHMYAPVKYSHQSFYPKRDQGIYPNKNIIIVENGQYHSKTTNKRLNYKDSKWQFLKGDKVQIDDKYLRYAIPSIIGNKVSGTAYFDDMIIKEYNPNGKFIKDIKFNNSLNNDRNWDFWSNTSQALGFLSENFGHNDRRCIVIQNSQGFANFKSIYPVELKYKHFYQISGWAKGGNLSSSSNISFQLDFYKTRTPVFKRNKDYLEFKLNQILEWGEKKNVPLFLGEFGSDYKTFEAERGGKKYLNDMFDLILDKNLHFSLHEFSGNKFGLYNLNGENGQAEPINRQLINLVLEKLN